MTDVTKTGEWLEWVLVPNTTRPASPQYHTDQTNIWEGPKNEKLLKLIPKFCALKLYKIPILQHIQLKSPQGQTQDVKQNNISKNYFNYLYLLSTYSIYVYYWKTRARASRGSFEIKERQF